jgi:hypothetical protein
LVPTGCCAGTTIPLIFWTVDILGGATGLNFASEYRNVDGIVFPTKRRVYAFEGEYQIVKEPLLVAIDMGEVSLD